MNLITEDLYEELPLSIRTHPDVKIWGTCWWRPNKEEKMTTIVFCGERGSGKSYSLLKVGDMLHRTIKDKPLFKIKRMGFTASQFKRQLNDDYSKGTVICLDDAGLALYNKEALTRVVREIGKSLQTIRRKNPIILMSLPFFKLLEGHTKMFADLYVEIVDRDADRKQNLIKVQDLIKNYYTGDIYRQNILKYKRIVHPKFGISYGEPIPKFFRLGLPRQGLYEPYEKLKAMEMDLWDAESLKRVELEEKKSLGDSKPKVSFGEVLKYVSENIEKFKSPKNGRVLDSKILEVFNGEEKPTIGMTAAKMVAKSLNSQK